MALNVNAGVYRLKRLSTAQTDIAPQFYGPSGIGEAAGGAVGAPSGGGGGNAVATFQKQMAGLYGVVGAVNSALTAMSSVIKTTTTQALIQESRARGELSKALQTQASFSATAEYLKSVPLVGGALGGMAQAAHEARQQQIGTRHIAAAAAIIESRIPQMHTAGDTQALAIAQGRLRERFAADPAQEQYQQQILGLRATGAGARLQELAQARQVLGSRVAESEAGVRAAEAAAARLPIGGGVMSAVTRERAGEDIEMARERLRMDRESRARLESPMVLGAEAKLRAGVATQEEQAGKDLIRAYSLRLAPSVGTSYASFARGPAGPGQAPAPDQITASASLTAAMNELTTALKGINPTTVGK